MKFIITSLKLLRSLQALSGVLNSSNTLPILDDFLFRIQDSELEITASDLETTMIISLVPDLVEGKGEVAIPAKILLDIMKTFPDIPVTFEVNPDTLTIELLAGEGKFKLAGHRSDEFPKLPTIVDTNRVELKGEVLVNAFEKTVFATGNDELRPAMSGVLCELKEEHITFVATDAHKLVRYRRLDAKSDFVASFILPKKPINQLKNILSSRQDETVLIDFNQTNAHFTFSNVKMVCRLIEGRYPNYEAVIPAQNPNKLTIDRAALLNSLRPCCLSLPTKAHIRCVFKISGLGSCSFRPKYLDYA